MDIQTAEQSGVFTAILSGRFTFNDNQNFRQFLRQIESSQTLHTIRLECAGIDFIDSAALGMLLILHDTALEKGVRVMLCGAQGQFQRMIEISKFDLLFTIEPLMRHG